MPSRRHTVVLQVAPAFVRETPKRRLTSLARQTLVGEGVAMPAELSIVVTDDATIQSLNRRYRDQDSPTDVLSFGCDPDGTFVTPPESPRQLGEVVISYPTAERQAAEHGVAAADELEHLLIHGILHLLGFDHAAAAEARTMRAREETHLGRPVH